MIRFVYAFRGAFAAAHLDELEVRFEPLEPTNERRGVVKIEGHDFDMGWTKSKKFREGTIDTGPEKSAEQFQFQLAQDINLRFNLAAIARDTKTSGAHLILMTYGSEHNVYGAANQSIRRTARELGASFVADGPPPSLEGRRIPSFGVPYTPKCLEWPFEIPIRLGHRVKSLRIGHSSWVLAQRPSMGVMLNP